MSKTKAAQAERYQRLRSRGLCVRCECWADGKAHCTDCGADVVRRVQKCRAKKKGQVSK